MKKKNRIFRHLGCVLCAALFCVVTVLFARFTMEGSVPSLYPADISMPENSVSIWDEAHIQAYNSEKRGQKIFGADREDPYLVFRFPEEEGRRVRGVELILWEGFSYDANGSLFYPNEKNGYDGNCRSNYKLPKGATSFYFEVPEDVAYNLDRIRIDIDEDYIIKDIRISEEPLQKEYRPLEHYHASSVVVRFAVWFMLLEMLCWLWPRITVFFSDIRSRSGKILTGFLVLAGSAVGGAVGAYVLFRLTGKEFTWFWALAAAFCCMVVGYEIYLLLRRNEEADRAVKTERKITGMRLFFWGIILVFCLLIGFEWIDAYLVLPKIAGMNSFQLPFLFAAAETVLLALLYQKYVLNKREDSISFLNVYTLIFFLLGLAYILLFLPYVSPDEPDHYTSAYRVSNLLLGKGGDWGSERLLMRLEDYRLYDAKERLLTPEYYMQVTDGISLFAKESGEIAVRAPMVTNAVFGYLTSGLGIAVGRVLHLSGYLTFILGRFTNLLFFTIALRYLMKKIPFGRTALFTIAVMPMTLHTVASYSYDVTTIWLVALFVTQVMCMICSRERISRRDYWLCVLYGALMAPSKMIYIPLLFMVLLVPDDKMGAGRKESWKRKILLIGISLAVTAGIMLTVNMLSAGASIRKVVEQSDSVNILSYNHEPGYTLSWILGNLPQYVLMVIRTPITLTDTYFFSLIGSSLGWMDIGVPHAYAVVSVILFLLAVNIQDDASRQVRIGAGKRAWILLLSAGTIFCAMLVMTVSWTPLSSNYITGVQGRYFTPLLVPLIWLMRNHMIQVKSVMRKHIVFLATLLNIWVLIYVFAQMIIDAGTIVS